MSDRIWFGTRKGLFTAERDRKSACGWSIAGASFLGVPVTAVLPDARDGSVYAALKHGHFGPKIHRSKDGGRTWEDLATPQYPPKPEGVDDVDPNQQKPVPWSLEMLWVLEAGTKAQPGVLWAGTIPGGLFRSSDGGATWSLNRPLWDHPSRKEWFGGGYDFPGIHSIAVDPNDGRRVRVGISCGGVWETRDGGETWEARTRGMYAAFMPPERKEDPAIQDPHRIAQCTSSPDHLWCQHHNAAFRSTDGGKTWTDLTTIAPSNFGFAVAAHPKDANTAWFVPAKKDEDRIPVDGKVVVARTRDGGATFEILRRGLPQEHAYDLVYRHALDVDDTGDHLAFGSTTGNAWVTADQGDTWAALSHHLPPINCVRFGG